MKYLNLIILSACLALTIPDAAADLTLEQAIAMVKKRTGGRVLAAQARQVDGRTEFRIKILDKKGHVRSLSIDPKQ